MDDEVTRHWIHAINAQFTSDRLLTDKLRYGKQALPSRLVPATWLGTLSNECELPNKPALSNRGFSRYRDGLRSWAELLASAGGRLAPHTACHPVAAVRNGISSQWSPFLFSGRCNNVNLSRPS